MSIMSNIYKKPINFILAVSSDNVIGIDNKIPWKIKEDLAYFKNLTTYDQNESHNKWLKENNIELDNFFPLKPAISNMVIMGLKTFESIGSKPLPNRLNVVLTSKYETMTNQENLVFLSNISNAIYYGNICSQIKTIWIIGGKQLFESISDIKPNNVYLSTINKTFDTPNLLSKTIINDKFFEYLYINYELEKSTSKIVCDLISNTDVEIEFKSYKFINDTNNEIYNTDNIVNCHYLFYNCECDNKCEYLHSKLIN